MSVANNSSTMFEVLDRILDKGIIESSDNSQLCCPDCLQEIYDSPVIPASPLNGLVETNENNYRIYVLSSVETFLKYAESVGITLSAAVPALAALTSNPKIDCCLHVKSSIETTLKLTESMGEIPNDFTNCSENFTSCINNIFNVLTPEGVDRILDKGVVEYGSISGQSQLCKVLEFIELAYTSQTRLTFSKAEILGRILDKGIVISCYNGEISISSVETFLKWWEGNINNNPGSPA